ncbi:unnamed protein product, partial [Rotaria sp. Silwood2]
SARRLFLIEGLSSVDYQTKANVFETVDNIYAVTVTSYPLAIEYFERALELINTMYYYNSSRKANLLLKLSGLYEETAEIDKAVR